MLINRIGGDATEGLTFDGRFAMPNAPMRRMAIYDSGSREIAVIGVGCEKWLDGHDHIVRGSDGKVAWIVDPGSLAYRLSPNPPKWEFDGRLLRPCVHWENDEWMSTEDAPLLVMMLAAGLI